MTLQTKFSIKDPGVFWSLQTVNQLGKYTFSDPKIIEIEDTYLDTKKRRLLTAGYSCRQREQEKKVLVTLVDLNSLKSNRTEPKIWETQIKEKKSSPVDWPESKVRKKIIKVISEKKIRKILELHQSRITRTVTKNNQPIAQVNLDDVSWFAGRKEQHFKELNIIWMDENTTHAFQKLISTIQNEWGLDIQTLTKYEQVLGFK